MIHYHGTPITPRTKLMELGGRSFCVRYGEHRDIEVCHNIGEGVMLDNGAFSFWRQSRATDWPGYYDWCEPWLDYRTTWAVIPDVIDGSEEENDLLLASWFQRRLPRGAPVWHLDESIDRLKRLCHGYERVCIGSSGVYDIVGSPEWHRRMERAMDSLCGSGSPPAWLHMLRGLSLAGSRYPFASADSTNIARNHSRNGCPVKMATAIDARQCPARWERAA